MRPGKDFHRRLNRRALLVFVFALVLVVTATGAVVGTLQGRFLRDEAQTRFLTELGLLGQLSVEPLLRSDYTTVERLVDAWVQQRPDPLQITAIAPNGFVLASAQNRESVENALSVDLPVEFNGRRLLTLQAVTDVSASEVAVTTIARDVALTAALLVTLLGWMLWGILQRTALRPLENEVRTREQKEQELRQRTAELETALGELETFSYSVSHDLRTPLRAIDGFSRVIEEDYAHALDAEARNHLARMRAAAQHMGDLIDDLLELARTTHQTLQPVDADLGELATESLKRLAQEAPQRRVDIVIADGLAARVDVPLMRIALDNLLGNAWKYTALTPVARIEFGARQENGETVYHVCDNGTGFDMRYADKLFKPFHRLHGSDFPGTGIGLPLVQRIIQRHGGRIWANSAPGKGACFHFTLGDAPPDAAER
ncbi:MAG: sensor histidine kinase [Pseudomonadota bacterium]